MAGSLTAVLICAVGFVLVEWGVEFNLPLALALVLLYVVVLPISGVGFLVGVVLSLTAPRQARLGRWIGAYLVGVVAGVVLLLAAWSWRQLPPAITGTSWRTGRLVLVWSGVEALLVAHLGYCLYLAGVARRFDAGRLARWFVAFFVWLALQGGLIALADVARRYWWQQTWRPLVRADWKEEFIHCAALMVIGTGAGWVARLRQLRRRLPRDETPPGPDGE